MAARFQFYRVRAPETKRETYEPTLVPGQDRIDAQDFVDAMQKADGKSAGLNVSEKPELSLLGLDDFEERLKPVSCRRAGVDGAGYVIYEGCGHFLPKLAESGRKRGWYPWTVYLPANCSVPLIEVVEDKMRYEGRLGLVFTERAPAGEQRYCMMR